MHTRMCSHLRASCVCAHPYARYLYPHLHFSVGYNVDQIVSVNVSTNPQRKLDITEENTDVDVSFSYRYLDIRFRHQKAP